MVQMPLTYNDNTYRVEVLKVDNLPFLILLGRDTPTFNVLLYSVLPHLLAVVDKDVQPGPSGTPVIEPPLSTSLWDVDADYLRPQAVDPMLASVRDTVTVNDGQVLDVRRATREPHFEKVRETLW